MPVRSAGHPARARGWYAGAMSDSPLRALSEPRHTCLGCGGSCHGVRARLLGDEETERITRLAGELGVDQPIVDGVLRQHDGQCVFLDYGARCRIHATYGSASKPRICRQYPIVIVDTGRERRIGIDPGCYTAWQTRLTGEPVTADGLAIASIAIAPGEEAVETAILARLRGGSLRAAVGLLVPGESDEDGFPAGLRQRWLARLREADLGGLIARPETGPSARAALTRLVDALPGWEAPPSAAFDPDADAWAVDVARRAVFLRLQPHMPVPAVALLALMGATALAWVDPRLEHVGPGLAAWTRALRAPIFVRALVPDPAAWNALIGR